MNKIVMCVGCRKETTEEQTIKKEEGYFHFGCWQSDIWRIARKANGSEIKYGVYTAKWKNGFCEIY